MILVCSLLVAFLSQLQVFAQDNSTKILYFIYIDHEVATPVQLLSKHLQDLYESCDETGNAMIIYLSNGEESLISLKNLGDDPLGQKRDALEAFNNIIAALQNNNFHRVNALTDRSNILKIFEEFQVTDNSGEIQFRSVTMDFHIGPDYWRLHHNEKVIAPLYMALDVAKYPNNRFSFNVLCPQGTKLDYPDGQPFGIANLGNINNKLSIKEFVMN